MKDKNNKDFKMYSSFGNRKEILKSKQCGCCYCLKQFSSTQIDQWRDKDKDGIGQTAICPFCWIDSVIGDRYAPITEKHERVLVFNKTRN